MKAFFTSFAAVIVIAVLAGVVLGSIDDSSRATYRSDKGSVRL